MIRFRATAWAATALAAACLVLPASAAMASSAAGGASGISAVPPGAPTTGPEYLCANGGAGLCLQQNMQTGSLIANDTKIAGAPAKQTWDWNQLGTTTATTPFADVGLDKNVAVGRRYGQWVAVGAAGLCLGYKSNAPGEPDPGPIELLNCENSSGTAAQGTEWVLSGSGRMISVAASNDKGALNFLNSSGVNGGNPTVLSILTTASPNACPASCWGPNAG